MKGLLVAAGLGLALVSTGVKAADLYDDPPPGPRHSGGAYDDPRYADIYRYPDRYPNRPTPPASIYGDRDDAYSPPPRRNAYRGECVPRHVIRDRLIRDGWNDFALGEFYGNVATVQARRPSGRPFVLTVDRCTGDIVDARPAASPGPYAYNPQPPPRRWDRPYY